MSNWKIIREQDDPLALRLSIGQPVDTNIPGGYIVYRGETDTCITLLEEALSEFKKFKEEQGE